MVEAKTTGGPDRGVEIAEGVNRVAETRAVERPELMMDGGEVGAVSMCDRDVSSPIAIEANRARRKRRKSGMPPKIFADRILVRSVDKTCVLFSLL